MAAGDDVAAVDLVYLLARATTSVSGVASFMSATTMPVSFCPFVSSPYGHRAARRQTTRPSRAMSVARSTCHVRRGAIDQHLARGGGGARHLRRHPRRGLRAEGARVVRREIGIAHHQRDRIDRHAQLVGNRLGERGADVLADFHLAGEGGDASGFVHLQPCGEIGRVAAPVAALAARLLRVEAGEGNPDEQAAGLKELAALEHRRRSSGKPRSSSRPARASAPACATRPDARHGRCGDTCRIDRDCDRD